MSSYYMDFLLARVHHAELIKEAERERKFRQAHKSRSRSFRLQNLLAKITRHP